MNIRNYKYITRKIIHSILLLSFISHFYTNFFSIHIHYSEDGSFQVHSHPFNKEEKHTHSNNEMKWISILNSSSFESNTSVDKFIADNHYFLFKIQKQITFPQYVIEYFSFTKAPPEQIS